MVLVNKKEIFFVVIVDGFWLIFEKLLWYLVVIKVDLKVRVVKSNLYDFILIYFFNY